MYEQQSRVMHRAIERREQQRVQLLATAGPNTEPGWVLDVKKQRSWQERASVGYTTHLVLSAGLTCCDDVHEADFRETS
jgi:hypothetical protein